MVPPIVVDGHQVALDADSLVGSHGSLVKQFVVTGRSGSAMGNSCGPEQIVPVGWPQPFGPLVRVGTSR